jgi:molybdopterin-binding protein
MNKLTGKIESVTAGTPLASFEISLATGDSIAAIASCFPGGQCYKPGDNVEVFFDELDVILAKSYSGETTVKKKFMGVVKRVETDAAVCRVVVDYKGTLVAALVRTSSWKSLGLGVGDDVYWLIKATKVTVGTV